MKYLPLYYKWGETGRLPEHGLCNSLHSSKKLIRLFIPDYERDLDEEDSAGYWAYDGENRSWLNDYCGADSNDVFCEFTPLRQTVLLFMAAMSGEL